MRDILSKRQRIYLPFKRFLDFFLSIGKAILRKDVVEGKQG